MYTLTQRADKAPQSPLERALIKNYLVNKGYHLEDVQSLPADLAKKLMTEACTYASLRLAEIQARSLFLRKIQFED